MKKTVHFRGVIDPPEVGQPAFVFSIDHPDTHRVSNHTYARTSLVVEVFPNGDFETMNTMYVFEESHGPT